MFKPVLIACAAAMTVSGAASAAQENAPKQVILHASHFALQSEDGREAFAREVKRAARQVCADEREEVGGGHAYLSCVQEASARAMERMHETAD